MNNNQYAVGKTSSGKTTLSLSLIDSKYVEPMYIERPPQEYSTITLFVPRDMYQSAQVYLLA